MSCKKNYKCNGLVGCHSLLNNPPDNSIAMDKKRKDMIMPRKAKQDKKLDAIKELNRKK